MSSVHALLVSLLFLMVAAAALAKLVGWRALEELAARGCVTMVLAILALPLVEQVRRAAMEALRTCSGCDAPGGLTRGAVWWIVGMAVLIGHVAFGALWLRRRARADHRARASHDFDAARRRSRSRLPPPADEGPQP